MRYCIDFAEGIAGELVAPDIPLQVVPAPPVSADAELTGSVIETRLQIPMIVPATDMCSTPGDRMANPPF
jgi:hypothetical protein